MVEGQNQNSRNDKAAAFEGGTVHLLETSINDSDGSTELSNNSQASESTATSDWSITHDNGAGTTTLENTAQIDFGTLSGFTVNQVVIQSTNNADNLILDNSPGGSTNLTGSGNAIFESSDLTYTLGGE